MSDAFLNRVVGTFSETTKEWVIAGDQWSQCYYQWREPRLYWVENDNKEQQYAERELDIAAFLREHAMSTESPYADIVAFLSAQPR